VAIMMPKADSAVLERRDAIVAALRAIVPGEGVIDTPAEMLPYESDADGVTGSRRCRGAAGHHRAGLQVLRYCHEQGIRWCARLGHLALGRRAAARPTGCCWAWASSRRIREIDFDNRAVVTEPGVTTFDQPAVAHAVSTMRPIVVADRLFIAQYRGKFRRRALPEIRHDDEHVLGCEIVLITGEIVRIGGKSAETAATT